MNKENISTNVISSICIFFTTHVW